MDVWVAHRNHRALRVTEVDTSDDIAAVLGEAEGTGSTVFAGSTGHLPTVRGRFNPIADEDRYYVYVDNAAVAGKPARPAHFVPGEPFAVEDSDGSVTVVTILDVNGNGSLIEWMAASPT